MCSHVSSEIKKTTLVLKSSRGPRTEHSGNDCCAPQSSMHSIQPSFKLLFVCFVFFFLLICCLKFPLLCARFLIFQHTVFSFSIFLHLPFFIQTRHPLSELYFLLHSKNVNKHIFPIFFSHSLLCPCKQLQIEMHTNPHGISGHLYLEFVWTFQY